MAMTDLKARIRAWLGAHEDSSGTVAEDVGRLIRKTTHYEWPIALKAAALNTFTATNRLHAQTGSLSATQPLANRVVFIADKTTRVKEILWTQHVSTTVSTSATTSWSLIVQRKGLHNGTLSGSMTVTAFVGGLCSMTTGQPGYTGSYSHIIVNKPFAPNRLLLNRTASKLLLKRGDVLTAKVIKGANGVATSNGAIFFGGSLRIVTEEE